MMKPKKFSLLFITTIMLFTGSASAEQTLRQLYDQGIYFVTPLSSLGTCSTGSSLTINTDATALISGITTEARQRFDTQYPKVEAMRSVYEQQGGINDIPWEFFASAHYREGGNNPDQTPLDGKRYGEVNADGAGLISTVEQAYAESARRMRGLSKVYGVDSITTTRNYSVQDFAKIGVSYNRGNVYKRAYGQEEGPWFSPYAANFLDEARSPMTFPGPTVNGVDIESPNLAGKEDGNLGFVTFILLLYEKTGKDIGTISGSDTTSISSDPSSPCNKSGVELGAKLENITYFSQRDPAWADYPYPYAGSVDPGDERNIKTSGCGPTTMAMIIRTMSPEYSDVTPITIADENIAGGHRGSTGTSWSAFTEVLPNYGLSVEQIAPSETDRLADELRNGALAIGSFGPGTFTNGGHILVVRSVTEDNKFYVADPNDGDPGTANYQRKSTTAYDAQVMSGEAKAFFIIKKAATTP